MFAVVDEIVFDRMIQRETGKSTTAFGGHEKRKKEMKTFTSATALKSVLPVVLLLSARIALEMVSSSCSNFVVSVSLIGVNGCHSHSHGEGEKIKSDGILSSFKFDADLLR